MANLSAQIKRLKETSPDLSQADIALTLGCSEAHVSMVLSGKRGKDEAPAETVLDEGATELAMAKTMQALRLQDGADAKEDLTRSTTAMQNAKTWATLSGVATNRDRDRDEPMSDDEAEKLAAKFFEKAGEKVAAEAEAHLNQDG